MLKSIKKRTVRTFCVFLTIMMAITLSASCTVSQQTTTATAEQSATTTAGESSQEKDIPNKMPIVDQKIELTYLTSMPVQTAQLFETINDVPNMKELERITNIKVNYISIPASNFQERKNLIFASGDLPDMVWLNPAQNDIMRYGIEDDLLIEVDDLVSKYAYNYQQWVAFEPEIKTQALAPNGKQYHIPSIDVSLSYAVPHGYFIREEWLEKFSIEPPETIDELYDVLKIFKENDPAGNGNTIPLTGMNPAQIINPILCSFGVSNSMYQVDGTIKFGPVEPEFKDALLYLRKLYSEGLIYQDYLSQDANTYNSNLINNIGVTFALTVAGMQQPLISAGLDINAAQDVFRPILGMKGPDGKYYDMMRIWGTVLNNLGDGITSKNKYPVESMKWIDYKYSQEGSWTVFWGPKGKTWDIGSDGVPKPTDYVLKNPDGISSFDIMMQNGMNWHWVGVAQVFNRHKWTSHWPPRKEDINLNWTRFGENPETTYSKYVDNWFGGDKSRGLPPTLKLNEEEQSRADVLLRDITTYYDENIHKVVIGLEPLAKWDEVVQQLKRMNVDELISIYQAAYDRTLK